MHELSIAQALVNEIAEVVTAQSASVAKAVVVRIGQLSGVEAEALEQVFPMVAEGTCVEGAILRCEHVPAVAICRDCSRECPMDDLIAVCPACGSVHLGLKSGRELLIHSIEIE
jgi:hydrogenase nickel incorporation protein HypA/HybF